MFDIVDTISDSFVKAVETNLDVKDVIEIRSWNSKYTCDVIGNVAFGLECKCESYNRVFSC